MRTLRTEKLPLASSEDVVAVRQAVRMQAQGLGFSLVDQTKLVTAASEIARNTVLYGGGGIVEIEVLENAPRRGVRLTFEDHGPGIGDLAQAMRDGYTTGSGLGLGLGGGQLLVRVLTAGDTPLIEVLALDRGAGIADVARSLADGYSTAGSPGTGFGALYRLSSTFDIYSRAGAGTAVLARVGARRTPAAAPRGLRTEGLAIAKPGEDVCGDAWAAQPRIDGTMILVADGLGHGPGAAEASRAAVAAFLGSRDPSPANRLQDLHHALRSTRGAAAAIADLHAARGVVRFAGLGNIAGAIVTPETTRQMVSRDGTVGVIAARLPEFSYPLSRDAAFIIYSDGLTSHLSLSTYPGLLQR